MLALMAGGADAQQEAIDMHLEDAASSCVQRRRSSSIA
jgi:hypothetical protein